MYYCNFSKIIELYYHIYNDTKIGAPTGTFVSTKVNQQRLDDMEISCSDYGVTSFKFLMGYKGAQAAAQGLEVLEIDVPYKPRHAGRSKISGSLIGSMRAGIKMIYTIAKLRWQCGPRSTA